MNTETKIFEAELKDIQELQAKARKYDELKVAVGKIRKKITNAQKDKNGNLQPYIECDKCLEIFDKHTEGLV